jgi:DNA-binding MarR family transcriptional regulator
MTARPRRRAASAAAARDAELNAAIELLHFAYRAMIREPDRLLARRGLGRLHHRILYFVARSPGASVGELTRTLGVSKQALHAPLRELQAKALVAWTRAEADRRVKRLELTAAGRRLEATLSARQRAQFAGVFGRTGTAAERAWRRTMAAFAGEEMRRAGRIPPSPRRGERSR